MKILAIETSCDDTAIAVAECQSDKGFKLLSNIVSSQIEVHKKFGGVYPALARREHQKNLVPVLISALSEANIPEKGKAAGANVQRFLMREKILSERLEAFLKNCRKPEIDSIAVTKGPGLEPCLWTGINFARTLASAWKLPIVPVNHIEAHIFASWLGPEGIKDKQIFPAISLIASGGHTQIIFIQKIGKYKIIGETRDDAAGEAFDKIARILGLGYPGGPAIEKEAEKNNKLSIKLPRPMLYTKDYDFSFSGLKTAVLYDFRERKQIAKHYIAAMAKESQQAIVEILVKKTLKAAKNHKVRNIILGGGVSANKELRRHFREKIEKEKLDFGLYAPETKFCADNAAMIALTACLNKNLKPIDLHKLAAEANLKV